MEVGKLNELLDSFQIHAESLKTRLTDLLVIVSDGRIPREDILRSFHEEMDILISEYTQLKCGARDVLNAEEMPEEGSRASAYVEAVSRSRSRFIKLQMEKANAILRRFLKVKSPIAEYETVLLPFKSKAADVLQKISEENIEELISETTAPELFLEALDTENINGAEGFRVLGEINK